MKIETNQPEVCIDDIHFGEVFWYKDKYYIKVSHLDGMNAVNLANGSPTYFEPTDFIIAFPNAVLEIS